MTTILQLNSSAAAGESVTASLNAAIVDGLRAQLGDVEVVERDLTTLPVLDNARLIANNTPGEARTAEQVEVAAVADAVVAEVHAADVIVVGVPIYNFGVPASLKAWMDLVARAGSTFQYTENGPQGMVTGTRAFVTVASGGVGLKSEVDHATPHIETFLRFLGIDEIEIVDSTGLLFDPSRADAARARIGELVGS